MSKNLVYVKEVKYRGKANKIKWKIIEKDLKFLIGKTVIVDETKSIVNIAPDFPDEFTGSKYTMKLKGPLAKAKANISTIILELVKNAYNKRYVENKDEKHNVDAERGWERYDVDFAIPVYSDIGKFVYYNDYTCTMLVRLDKNGKNYLYDFINIKKGKCNPHG